MNIKLTSKTEIKDMISLLEQHGFQCHRVADYFISSKMKFLIDRANVLDLDIDSGRLISELKLSEIDSFEEIKRVLKEYFAKFGKEDKILQLIGALYPICATKFIVPGTYATTNEQNSFNQQLRKYGIAELPIVNGQPVTYIQIYILKPYQKIKIALNGRTSMLNELIQLVYGAEVDIDIKCFSNGNADLTGNVEVLRQCYIKYLTSRGQHNVIITE